MSKHSPEIRFSPKYIEYTKRRNREGKHTYIFRGGRRSGKTWWIAFLLLCRAYNGKVVNVASMTAEQGRLGAYADMKLILKMCPLTFGTSWECLESPREIRFHNGHGGKIIFNSYKASETAKGVACDDLYMNEANNFTQQHYTDLAVNVRDGIYLDFNPNILFWVDDRWTDEDICDTMWWDNKQNLTQRQIEEFEALKEAAMRPNASPLDIRNYNIYYLGKYSELKGNIFVKDDLTFIDRDQLPDDLTKVKVFADPSALVGADWFACVLSAKSKSTGKTYILDVYSVNLAEKEQIVAKLREWCLSYDRVKVYIETNGIIGQEFIKYAVKSGLPCEAYYSHANKFERICAQYENIKKTFEFVESAQLTSYMEQVYDFSNKCEHDDNADALASTSYIQQYT